MKTLTRMVAVCMALCAVAPAAVAADSPLFNVPQGTLVQLQLTDPVSTREAKPGDVVNLRVSDDVYLGTKLLITKGEKTTATITEVRGPKNWGRSGRLGFEFGAVKAVDGTDVALGPWSKEKDKQESMGYAAGATVGGAVLLGPVGLVGGMFVKGKHVDLPAGQEFKAAVRWDTAVKLGAPAATAPAATAPAAIAPVPPAGAALPVVVVPAPAPVAPKPAAAIAAPKKPEAAAPKKPEVKKEPEKIAPVIPIIEDVTGREPAKKN